MAAALAAWLDAVPGVAALRGSPVLYLFVNAAHILGLGLLLGAILPLDLRLVGVGRAVPLAAIGPFLDRVATGGLALALATGLALFSVRPIEYLANPAFRAKAVLLVAAAGLVAAQHLGPDLQRAFRGGPVSGRTRLLAALSAATWLGVLVAGRWIGFA